MRSGSEKPGTPARLNQHQHGKEQGVGGEFAAHRTEQRLRVRFDDAQYPAADKHAPDAPQPAQHRGHQTLISTHMPNMGVTWPSMASTANAATPENPQATAKASAC